MTPQLLTNPFLLAYQKQKSNQEKSLFEKKSESSIQCSEWYYDSALGRFISADTIIDGVFDPAGFNRYSYVKNNPIRYADPSGHYITSGGVELEGPANPNSLEEFETWEEYNSSGGGSGDSNPTPEPQPEPAETRNELDSAIKTLVDSGLKSQEKSFEPKTDGALGGGNQQFSYHAEATLSDGTKVEVDFYASKTMVRDGDFEKPVIYNSDIHVTITPGQSTEIPQAIVADVNEPLNNNQIENTDPGIGGFNGGGGVTENPWAGYSGPTYGPDSPFGEWHGPAGDSFFPFLIEQMIFGSLIGVVTTLVKPLLSSAIVGIGGAISSAAGKYRATLARAGDDLFVGTYNQVRAGNLKSGINATHTPHHVVQNAVSPTTHGRGIAINIRKDLHVLTSTFKNPNVSSGTLRDHLARDVNELRNILRVNGYDRSTVNRQLQELIKQNKTIW